MGCVDPGAIAWYGGTGWLSIALAEMTRCQRCGSWQSVLLFRCDEKGTVNRLRMFYERSWKGERYSLCAR